MRIYRSKIGFWAYLFLGCFLVLTGYLLIDNFVGGIVFTVFSAALVWFYLNIRYIITKEELIIKPFGPTIPLKDITTIEASSGYYLMASPALSLKRLMISYNGDSVFVSPQHEDQFIAELKQKCINVND